MSVLALLVFVIFAGVLEFFLYRIGETVSYHEGFEIQEKKNRLNLGKARAVTAPLRTTKKTSTALIFMDHFLLTIALPIRSRFPGRGREGR